MPVYSTDLIVADPANIADTSLPWADDDDALLTYGSVLLFDAQHTANSIITAPTAANTTLPNIAWKRFADLYGSATSTNSSISGTTLTVGGTINGVFKPGQMLSGGTTNANTYITGYGTANGGAGTYTVTPSQTVSANSINANAVVANTQTISRWTAWGDIANVVKTELSYKGGVHMMISQLYNTTDGQGYGFTTRQSASTWLVANAGHNLYFSQWDRLTRTANSSGSQTSEAHFIVNYSQGVFEIPPTSASSAQFNPSTNRLGFKNDPAAPNTLGPRFRSFGSATNTGALPIGATFYIASGGAAGPFSPAATYGNKSASRVLYRIYVEDLTASGRTYATVEALDYAMYVRDVLSPNGRYYGDTTPSTPSVALP